MSGDAEISRACARHVYEQIADIIAARITAGRYTIRLPSEHDLTHEFDVSHGTIRHARAILRERGLVVPIHGRGTYVASWLARRSG